VIKRNFFVKWYEINGRVFPWRNPGTTPFAFLVTEMLLRQTRASNVARIWESFINDYPNPKSIIKAPENELISRLKILGFGVQKTEALKSASTYLIANYEGRVPNKLLELLDVPHVGNYAARAVLCFAFGKRVEIVDTNVLRLFSRYFGIQLKPDIRRAPQAWEIAKQILPHERSKAIKHNYGILDFTADICKPGRPRCEICPLSSKCEWGKIQLGKVQAIK
jgi:A/G-specific adenine glycosylase